VVMGVARRRGRDTGATAMKMQWMDGWMDGWMVMGLEEFEFTLQIIGFPFW